MIRLAFALMALPTALVAGDLVVEGPIVPLAPPGAMAHAAYMTLTNTGDVPRQLIGVQAEGYLMAHIHRTELKEDIVSMSSVDLMEIAPGQTVAFEQGGLHVMLMGPESPLENGGTVELTLEFANGETLPVSAKVVPMVAGGHGHGS